MTLSKNINLTKIALALVLITLANPRLNAMKRMQSAEDDRPPKRQRNNVRPKEHTVTLVCSDKQKINVRYNLLTLSPVLAEMAHTTDCQTIEITLPHASLAIMSDLLRYLNFIEQRLYNKIPEQLINDELFNLFYTDSLDPQMLDHLCMVAQSLGCELLWNCLLWFKSCQATAITTSIQSAPVEPEFFLDFGSCDPCQQVNQGVHYPLCIVPHSAHEPAHNDFYPAERATETTIVIPALRYVATSPKGDGRSMACEQKSMTSFFDTNLDVLITQDVLDSFPENPFTQLNALGNTPTTNDGFTRFDGFDDLAQNPFMQPEPLHIPLIEQQPEIVAFDYTPQNSLPVTPVYHHNDLIDAVQEDVAEIENPDNVINHRTAHNQDKPFKCTYEDCNYTATQSGDLIKHRRVHTGERPFTCPYEGCGKSFARSDTLARHKRTHTKEKLFVCDHPGCNKTFAERGQLTRHAKTHTKKKPFSCTYDGCGKAFARSDDLKRHQKTHSDQRPFQCSYSGCSYAAKLKGILDQHVKNMHSNNR